MNMANQKPDRDAIAGDDLKRNDALTDLVEKIADENRSQTSNGNRESLPDSKAGSAQRGGPDIDKAQDRQPPDATRAREPTRFNDLKT